MEFSVIITKYLGVIHNILLRCEESIKIWEKRLHVSLFKDYWNIVLLILKTGVEIIH